jgi:hypothetical protein
MVQPFQQQHRDQGCPNLDPLLSKTAPEKMTRVANEGFASPELPL